MRMFSAYLEGNLHWQDWVIDIQHTAPEKVMLVSVAMHTRDIVKQPLSHLIRACTSAS